MKKIYLLLTLAIGGQLAMKAQSWSSVTPMDSVRAGLSLVTLADSKVLAIGGWDPSTGLNHFSAEVYDPGANSWTTTGFMSASRHRAKSVLLNNGKVLVTGGYNKACNCVLKTAELYDPATQTFSATGSMSVPRRMHTITLLNNGKVLVAGGTDGVSAGFHATAEIYDPALGTWSAAASMTQDRERHTATLLNSGKVFVTGGNNWNNFQVMTAEIYDPVSNAWNPGSDMTYTRDNHAAVKLSSGEVLITGGRYFEYATTGPYVPHYSSITEAEIYDAANDIWNIASNPMMPGMSYHSMILLNDGNVLSVGGADSSSGAGASTPSVTQIFNTASQTWSAMPMNMDGRFDFGAVKLNNGNVLVCGGATADCELFNYSVGVSDNTARDGKTTVYYSSTEKAFIINSSVKENSIVSIYDVTGRTVKEEAVPANDRLSISAEGLHAGIYLVKILNNSSSNSAKVLVR